jgi:DNA-binding cell septation regulator SpoVG
VQIFLRAYGGMTLDDFVVIKGFSVLVEKFGDLFVGMPYKKGKDAKYYDQVEFKKIAFILRDRILEAFKQFF